MSSYNEPSSVGCISREPDLDDSGRGTIRFGDLTGIANVAGEAFFRNGTTSLEAT